MSVEILVAYLVRKLWRSHNAAHSKVLGYLPLQGPYRIDLWIQTLSGTCWSQSLTHKFLLERLFVEVDLI